MSSLTVGSLVAEAAAKDVAARAGSKKAGIA
jgi:hypothetical protein